MIPYLRTENVKNRPLSRGTYLYCPYMGEIVKVASLTPSPPSLKVLVRSGKGARTLLKTEINLSAFVVIGRNRSFWKLYVLN